ncbi:transglycosylase domain-containing protein [Motilimonas sp. KMU-193]|uniref:transglycosylase domain-containing protein n=1 Tax=Motilimonas sp. KMU-193 TaxID=3388668 RepID=UPI00396B2E2A
MEQTQHEPPASLSVKRVIKLTLLAFIVIVIMLGLFEAKTSHFQSLFISDYARTLSYQLESGPSERIVFPSEGPFDQRLGYVALPEVQTRLLNRGFEISQQVRFSPALYDYTQQGFFAPYTEKVQAGLTLKDCSGAPFYRFNYPYHYYNEFSDIPPLVIQSLLFIENRHLLSSENPLANPAVDWPRLAIAAISQVTKALGMPGQSSGGSTLATQVEKYRHSEDGLTDSPVEKLKQMVSASVRAYRHGPETLAARKLVVWAYLNSVPLSAAPSYGEVHGIGDGLWVWFSANFQEVNRLLDPSRNQNDTLKDIGLALRQITALMIAHRRPSFYLAAKGRDELARLTDSYIRLFMQQGMISGPLMAAALEAKTQFRDFKTAPALMRVENSKGLQLSRARLSQLLATQFYDLDRMDLTANTSLNIPLQRAASDYLTKLADPEVAKQAGLIGHRLLAPEHTAQVNYSFTLMQQSPQGFKVRVQTDNTNQPFDINEGSKLELGSTAKIRVLTTYLEIIAELHQKYATTDNKELKKLANQQQDNLTRWALSYLMTNQERDLRKMLDAAMNRKYSANPSEQFFTGGGIHVFHNFSPQDNHLNATLTDSLRLSLNLPFVRLMRDIVRYSTYQDINRARLLSDDKHPQRQEYLSRFADREGKAFLSRFWKKYAGKTDIEQFDIFLNGLKQTPVRLAAVHRYILPQSTPEQFAQFIHQRLGNQTPDSRTLNQLYERYGPGKYSLPDQGYIARVHPLELWLLAYLMQTDQVTFSDAIQASQVQRQEVYGWLFKTRHRNARDSRIRTMLEVEAFLDIHQRWAKLGYPFQHLVPSLATALGSSGDRPVALATLLGIIQNGGVKYPTMRIESLAFAQQTPYETHFSPQVIAGERVMIKEVADTLKQALAQVVNDGTARRLAGVFQLPDGNSLAVGGKTGTGDNRIESVNSSGQVTRSVARNRTATLVFYIGDSYFGTLTAYVAGNAADKFSFTSALPSQVLKAMAPMIAPYLSDDAITSAQPSYCLH